VFVSRDARLSRSAPGGILVLTDGGTLANSAIAQVVVDNGVLAFDRSDNLTYAGTISGSGGVLQEGTGNLTLAGQNTFTGTSTVSSGILSIASDANLGIVPTTTVANQLSLAGGTLLVTSSMTLAATRGMVLGPQDKIPSGSVEIDVATGQTLVYNGTISNASFPYALVVGSSGRTGTLTLGGAINYTGATTVSFGTLIVNGSYGSVGLAAGTTVAATGTLAGAGVVGATTNAGILNPGSSGVPGLLTVSGNLTLGTGTLFLDLGANASDEVNVTGSTIDLTGSTLSLNVAAIVPGETFTILAVPGTSSSALKGTFANLPATGSSFTVGSQTFTINYAGGDGNDIVLFAGPPPTLSGTVLNADIAYVDSPFATAQHSMIESVVYSFNTPVTLSASNFAITGIAGTTTVPMLSDASTNGGTIWTVTFSGAGVNNGTRSIGDGEYQLSLSGDFGMTNSTYDFFRLMGDMNGDGVVNISDFSTLVSNFLHNVSTPLPN
jgi:fibronectin-binding autotransporter adhesin